MGQLCAVAHAQGGEAAPFKDAGQQPAVSQSHMVSIRPEDVQACQPHRPGCQRVGRQGRNRLIDGFRCLQHGIGEIPCAKASPQRGARHHK